MHLWAFQDLRATLRCELALADLVGVLGALARAVFALPFLVDTVQALASDLVSEHPIGARHHFSVRVPSCCDSPFSITASFGYCADALLLDVLIRGLKQRNKFGHSSRWQRRFGVSSPWPTS
jgi:hypothetical protein